MKKKQKPIESIVSEEKVLEANDGINNELINEAPEIEIPIESIQPKLQNIIVESSKIDNTAKERERLRRRLLGFN